MTNVGVRRQKVPGDPADKFGLNSASATLAQNDQKKWQIDDVEHFPETLDKACLSCL